MSLAWCSQAAGPLWLRRVLSSQEPVLPGSVHPSFEKVYGGRLREGFEALTSFCRLWVLRKKGSGTRSGQEELKAIPRSFIAPLPTLPSAATTCDQVHLPGVGAGCGPFPSNFGALVGHSYRGLQWASGPWLCRSSTSQKSQSVDPKRSDSKSDSIDVMTTGKSRHHDKKKPGLTEKWVDIETSEHRHRTPGNSQTSITIETRRDGFKWRWMETRGRENTASEHPLAGTWKQIGIDWPKDTRTPGIVPAHAIIV